MTMAFSAMAVSMQHPGSAQCLYRSADGEDAKPVIHGEPSRVGSSNGDPH